MPLFHTQFCGLLPSNAPERGVRVRAGVVLFNMVFLRVTRVHKAACTRHHARCQDREKAASAARI